MLNLKDLDWAHVSKSDPDHITIDCDKAYPKYVKELSQLDSDLFDGTMNKFSAEVARRCAILDIRRIFARPIYVKLVGTHCRLKDLDNGPQSAEEGASTFRRYYREMVVARGEILL